MGNTCCSSTAIEPEKGKLGLVDYESFSWLISYDSSCDSVYMIVSKLQNLKFCIARPFFGGNLDALSKRCFILGPWLARFKRSLSWLDERAIKSAWKSILGRFRFFGIFHAWLSNHSESYLTASHFRSFLEQAGTFITDCIDLW